MNVPLFAPTTVFYQVRSAAQSHRPARAGVLVDAQTPRMDEVTGNLIMQIQSPSTVTTNGLGQIQFDVKGLRNGDGVLQLKPTTVDKAPVRPVSFTVQ